MTILKLECDNGCATLPKIFDLNFSVGELHGRKIQPRKILNTKSQLELPYNLAIPFVGIK